MSDTAEELREMAEKRRLEVILAEVELAITLQRLSLLEHATGALLISVRTHASAVESLGRARHLLAQVPSKDGEMWLKLDMKIRELEPLLEPRVA